MRGLAGKDAGEIVTLLRRREVSAVEVARDHLAAIEQLDGTFHAFLSINPRIEQDAAEADRKLAAGLARPLEGLPVAIKDNIVTRGLPTSCASRALEGFVPVRDATVVARLRDAGAIVLGKTNLDEFAMGSSTEYSAFGPTRNPWDPERVPGGSSGGSAAAVAAGMAPVALGSETGGSVRQPAAFCGVTGVKPTYGRVSRSGLVAFASSLDQVGPIARTVRDAAVLLEAVAGADPRDATSSAEPVDDYRSACERGVASLRVGLPREYFAGGLDPEIDEAVRRTARWLEDAGARVDEISMPHSRFAIPVYCIVAMAEASSNLARYDGVRYGYRSDVRDTLARMYRITRGSGFGAEVRRRILIGTFVLSAGYYDAYYAKATRVRTLVRRDFLDAFETGFDVLLTPTTPTPAFKLGDKLGDPLEMYLSDVYTATVNLAGVPAISVPVGLSSRGLPIGAQLVAGGFRESTLFRAAAVIEQKAGRLSCPCA